MHAETARFLLAEREQVDAPAQQKERHHADERRDESKLQIARFGRRERAHQPVCDGRELLFGVRDELYKRCARREQRADNDAGEHHGERAVHAACPADAPRERHRAHAADERAHRHAKIVERQKNAERRAEARAVGCAENVRRYHRVAEHALICRTRNGKSRADQRRERHARQTDVQNDRLFLAGIQFPRHFRAEELAHPLAQRVPQNAEKRSRRNGKPPQQERTEKQQQKRRCKHPEPPGIDRCFIRRNSVPPFHVFSPENSTTPHTSLSTK